MTSDADSGRARDRPELLVADREGWRRWLAEHRDAGGVRLVLARRGTLEPTRLVHREALEEALCFGWIDGQGSSRDEATWRVLFTPRRPRSLWSRRNVELAERLLAEGRMDPAGIAELERAKADGRYERAYAPASEIQVPDDLAAALAERPAALATFERLNAQNRYSILYRLTTARRPETRSRRLEQVVAMLERGETTLLPARPGGGAQRRRG
jgi:uncharacterized protein YdeI (YjbR/CyaY-like superfamily)